MLDFHKPETPVQWLIFLGAAGIILSSPAGTRAFLKELHKYFDEKGKNRRKYDAQKLSQALYYLKRRKIIKIIELKNGETKIELTERGRRKKMQYDVENLRISNQAKWDGKWRILMFDIPEKEKGAREALRNKIKELGLIQFQKSVWLYPYPCENEIDFIAEYYQIGKYINLITVKIESDKPLRAQFEL